MHRGGVFRSRRYPRASRLLCAVIDKETADEINHQTIKLAAKVAVLFQEKVIKPEAGAALQAPLNAAANAIIDALEGRPGSINPAAAAAAIDAACGVCTWPMGWRAGGGAPRALTT